MLTVLGGLIIKVLLPLTLLAVVLYAIFTKLMGAAIRRLPYSILPVMWAGQHWKSLSIPSKKFWINATFGLFFVVTIRIAQPFIPVLHSTINGFGFDLINTIGYAKGEATRFGLGAEGPIPEFLNSVGFNVPAATERYARIQFDEHYLDVRTTDQGIPGITLREDILDVFHKLIDAKPKLIILDIDLAYSPYSAQAQQALIDFLSQHRKPQPPVILVRTLLAPKEPLKHNRWATTPFDELENSPDSAVWWASTVHALDADNRLRTTHLSSSALDSNNRLTTLPGVAALAAGLINGDQEKSGLLNQTFSESSPARINYTLHPSPSNWDRLTSVPATTLLFHPHMLSKNELRNRVVIVSASHHRSGDEHLTNVGWMQGDLYLLNAIESLLRSGPLKEPGWIAFLSASLPVIIIFAAIAARFEIGRAHV